MERGEGAAGTGINQQNQRCFPPKVVPYTNPLVLLCFCVHHLSKQQTVGMCACGWVSGCACIFILVSVWVCEFLLVCVWVWPYGCASILDSPKWRECSLCFSLNPQAHPWSSIFQKYSCISLSITPCNISVCLCGGSFYTAELRSFSPHRQRQAIDGVVWCLKESQKIWL